MTDEIDYKTLQADNNLLRHKLEELEKKYFESLIQEQTPDSDRIAELEIKMAKLWAILTDKPKNGKPEKASKFTKKVFRPKFQQQ